MNFDELKITDAEMEILKLLWRIEKPITAGEIGLALSHRQWKLSTIHTLLMRLESRGVSKYFKAEGRKYYFPAITEFDYRFMVTKTFLSIIYEGSHMDMVQTLLCDWDLTRDGLKSLKELVGAAVPPKEAYESFGNSHDAVEESETVRVADVIEDILTDGPENGVQCTVERLTSRIRYAGDLHRRNITIKKHLQRIKLILKYNPTVEFVHNLGYNSS